MTDLEKALLGRIDELEKKLERASKNASEYFESNVHMADALCAIEDHLVLLKGDGPRAIFMENVVESDESTDFAKIYECFKYSLEKPEEEEAEANGG